MDELIDGIDPELIDPKQYATTTDHPIPDDVMWEARAVFFQLHATKADLYPSEIENDVEIIARALLARDQRAAEIARGMYSGRQIGFSAGQSIANAILAQGDKR